MRLFEGGGSDLSKVNAWFHRKVHPTVVGVIAPMAGCVSCALDLTVTEVRDVSGLWIKISQQW